MIAGPNYWLLTSLPTLDGPDTPPPFSPVELRARAAGSDGARLVDVILLSDDLRQRQAIQAREPVHSEAAVLTPAQLSGSDPLPASLRPNEPIPVGVLPEELVWQAYWAYAAAVARKRRSRLLGAWAHTEAALRNGLAAARARALGVSERAYPVPGHLEDAEAFVQRAVAEWEGASDPLFAWRGLLRARWDWAIEREPRYSFGRDELAAYAVKLLIQRDWHRTRSRVG